MKKAELKKIISKAPVEFVDYDDDRPDVYRVTIEHKNINELVDIHADSEDEARSKVYDWVLEVSALEGIHTLSGLITD